MKTWHKILLSILAIVLILFLISLTTKGGRFFWNQAVVAPVLKPFSEPCGYGGTSGYRVDCICDGTLIKDVRTGSTSYHCLGQCGECKCYEQDWSGYSETGEVKLTEVDCATFSQLSWAFPLEITAKECAEEGESFVDAPLGSPYYSGADEVIICCEGLEKKHTYDSQAMSRGKCISNKGPRYICIKCGDGTCGLGEDKCNCPEDCPGIDCAQTNPDICQGLSQGDRVPSCDDCNTCTCTLTPDGLYPGCTEMGCIRE